MLSSAQHSRRRAESFIGGLAEEAVVGVLGWQSQVILMLEGFEGLHGLQLDLLVVVMCSKEGPFKHKSLTGSGLILDRRLHGCAHASGV